MRRVGFPRALMCGHVRRNMYVSPRGNVLPCMSMVGGPLEEKFPNMLETPLEDILDRDPRKPKKNARQDTDRP